jgi:hypothetical protein
MKTATRVSVAGILVLWTLTAAAATNGSLKVTSFPSGAQVWVDGVDTGKVTPMSISLTEGDHTITVQLPGSGWNPDTRTVTIVPGNNDLSVTLLPTITTGPPGPPGAPGAPGTPGAPAIVRAAGSGECPTGGIVVSSGDGATSLPVCNGAQGIQGLQGLQGLQGIQGIQGEPGPPGQPGETPGIDPATLVSFGSNLRVDLGDGSGDLPLGISPVYVEIPASMNEVSGPNITYTPSPTLRVAPFAIAANMRLRDEESRPADYSPKLTRWFDDSVRTPSEGRTIRVKLRDTQADNLTIELTECLPTTLDSNFASLVRVVVECRAVSSMTVVGQPPRYPENQLFLPIRPVVPLLVLNLRQSHQLIADVSGGRKQVVDALGRIAITALHMRVGTVTNEDGFSTRDIASWIAASLARDPNGQFETIEIVGPDETTLAVYWDMFLTSIGLINPGRTLGSVTVPPNSVFNDIADYPPILIGFDLSMLPGQR